MSKVFPELNVNANQVANILICHRKHIWQHFTRMNCSSSRIWAEMRPSLHFVPLVRKSWTKNRSDVGHREAMIYHLIAWQVGCYILVLVLNVFFIHTSFTLHKIKAISKLVTKKVHGEKSHKCNQCKYSLSSKKSEGTFENAQWGKVKEVQLPFICQFKKLSARPTLACQ